MTITLEFYDPSGGFATPQFDYRRDDWAVPSSCPASPVEIGTTKWFTVTCATTIDVGQSFDVRVYGSSDPNGAEFSYHLIVQI